MTRTETIGGHRFRGTQQVPTGTMSCSRRCETRYPLSLNLAHSAGRNFPAGWNQFTASGVSAGRQHGSQPQTAPALSSPAQRPTGQRHGVVASRLMVSLQDYSVVRIGAFPVQHRYRAGARAGAELVGTGRIQTR